MLQKSFAVNPWSNSIYNVEFGDVTFVNDTYMFSVDVRIVDHKDSVVASFDVNFGFNYVSMFSFTINSIMVHYDSNDGSFGKCISHFIDLFKNEFTKLFAECINLSVDAKSIRFVGADFSILFIMAFIVKFLNESIHATIRCAGYGNCFIDETKINSAQVNDAKKVFNKASNFDALVVNFSKVPETFRYLCFDDIFKVCIRIMAESWCSQNEDFLKSVKIETLIVDAFKQKSTSLDRIQELYKLYLVDNVLESDYVHEVKL